MASKPLPVFDWSATNRASVHGYDFRVVQFESTKQWALLVFHGDYITASYTYTAKSSLSKVPALPSAV